MPAPQGSALSNEAINSYAGSLGDDAKDYIKAVMDAVASAWSTWQSGAKAGGLIVNGVGVGAWVGTGTGGSITAPPFNMADVLFKQNTPQQQKFSRALASVLKEKFATWASSYKFASISFTGVCTATPVNPGPFSANNVPTPLSGAGTGTNLSGISDGWLKLLTKPDFDVSNPQAKTKDMTDAIGAGIEKIFATTWLTSTSFSGDSVTGPATPGGVGSGTSLPSGTLV